jgi:Flp pilus assembly pilin Flp
MDSASTTKSVTRKTYACTRVLRDRQGAATIEYALLAALIAIAASVGLVQFGSALSQEISGLSRNFGLAEASAGCRRVEWTDADLKFHVSKHTPELSRLR